MRSPSRARGRVSPASTGERTFLSGCLLEYGRLLWGRAARSAWTADGLAAAAGGLLWVLVLAAVGYWLASHPHEQGLLVALAAMVVVCPCTYGAATALFGWLGLRKALAHGVLLGSAGVLEELGGVTAVVFDHGGAGGVLTQGELSVQRVHLARGVEREEALGLAAALEEGNRHPAGRALVELTERAGKGTVPLARRRFDRGRGVCGWDVQGRELRLGPAAYLEEAGIPVAACKVSEETGETLWEGTDRLYLAVDGRVWASFVLGERLHPEARAALAALRAGGMERVLLARGRRALALGLDLRTLIGETAEERRAQLEALARGGRGKVALVAGTLQEALAFAAGGPSFVLGDETGGGSGPAAVTLPRPHLGLVPWTLALGRRVRGLARRSVALAMIYNLACLGLALGGVLSPAGAGLGMFGSLSILLGGALELSVFPGPGPSVGEAVDERASAGAVSEASLREEATV